MIESEAGHVLEMDDTPNAERLHMYHRSGTRLEVLPDGSQTLKVVNDNYEITLKDKKILIGGSADIELVNGNHNLQVYNGDISLTAHKGNINLSTLDSSKATIIKGKVSLNGTAYD